MPRTSIATRTARRPTGGGGRGEDRAQARHPRRPGADVSQADGPGPAAHPRAGSGDFQAHRGSGTLTCKSTSTASASSRAALPRPRAEAAGRPGAFRPRDPRQEDRKPGALHEGSSRSSARTLEHAAAELRPRPTRTTSPTAARTTRRSRTTISRRRTTPSRSSIRSSSSSRRSPRNSCTWPTRRTASSISWTEERAQPAEAKRSPRAAGGRQDRLRGQAQEAADADLDEPRGISGGIPAS